MLGEVRVDALLPAVGALGAQAQALRAAEDPGGLEVGRLEQDGGRLVADLGLLAAHDPREGDRALGVADQQVLGLERAVDAVERAQLLAGLRAAHDDPAAVELGEVEGVQWVAEREHHVVGHIDDVRDRAHAGVGQPGAQPDR